jgi:hypothetical protein
MKKRNFVPWIFILMVFAFPASAAFAAAPAAWKPIPGSFCLNHQVTQCNDPNIPTGFTTLVTIAEVSTGLYRVTSVETYFADSGATLFCEGFGEILGSSLVSTLSCTIDGSQITSPYPWWASGTYHCSMPYKKGKVGWQGGYFWSIYAYAVPPLVPPTPTTPPGGVYPYYSYYGEYTGFSCSIH